jgi:OHCU decarboxylase
MTGIERLNQLPAEQVAAALAECCGSREWTRRMVASRPFASADQLIELAETIWWELAEQDWLEAFRSHPRIGERKAEAAQTQRERGWSAGEQAGVSLAAPDTLQALARGNREYEERFGYIYIVCASGRSADEMLSFLRQRLHHTPEEELPVAAAEQARITRLRLEKLLSAD